jgi:hypothetical protein
VALESYFRFSARSSLLGLLFGGLLAIFAMISSSSPHSMMPAMYQSPATLSAYKPISLNSKSLDADTAPMMATVTAASPTSGMTSWGLGSMSLITAAASAELPLSGLMSASNASSRTNRGSTRD